MVKDESLKPYKPGSILYVYSIIFTIISFSFLLILHKLRPLIRLRRKIAKFGEGDMKISFKTNSCDEIGLVSNEIEAAREKINQLFSP